MAFDAKFITDRYRVFIIMKSEEFWIMSQIWGVIFIPYKETDPNATAFESSVFGQFCNKDKLAKEDKTDEDKIAETEEKKEQIPVMKSILTVNYLLVRVPTQKTFILVDDNCWHSNLSDTFFLSTFVTNIYVSSS